MTTVTFSSVASKYAPKRKFLDFAKPTWHNKLGEFNDPDVLCWINNVYQARAFPTRADFNKAYDDAVAAGLMPSAGVSWRNKTMVLTAENLEELKEELSGEPKLLAKIERALAAEKVIFVY
jgi:hypothetical protein